MKNEFVMVPSDLAESAVDAFASIGTHDELDQLNEILSEPAQQHQGEPVAWLVKCKQSGLVEQAEPNEKASNPEHWTDAFPVYDSPKSARSQFDYDRGFAAGTAECETLRAQLAERDALLREKDDVLMAVKEQFDRHGNSFPDRFDSRVFRWVNDAVASASAEPSAPAGGKFTITKPIHLGRSVNIGAEYDRIKKILNEVRPFFGDGTRDATDYLQLCADIGLGISGLMPSAPVEIDERAEFEKHYASKNDGFVPAFFDGEYDWHDAQPCWEAWQARAAVERKQ